MLAYKVILYINIQVFFRPAAGRLNKPGNFIANLSLTWPVTPVAAANPTTSIAIGRQQASPSVANNHRLPTTIGHPQPLPLFAHSQHPKFLMAKGISHPLSLVQVVFYTIWTQYMCICEQTTWKLMKLSTWLSSYTQCYGSKMVFVSKFLGSVVSYGQYLSRCQNLGVLV